MTLTDYPAEAILLPDIHRDRVDRMPVAHALHTDPPIVTADATIHRYPVRTIW